MRWAEWPMPSVVGTSRYAWPESDCRTPRARCNNMPVISRRSVRHSARRCERYGRGGIEPVTSAVCERETDTTGHQRLPPIIQCWWDPHPPVTHDRHRSSLIVLWSQCGRKLLLCRDDTTSVRLSPPTHAGSRTPPPRYTRPASGRGDVLDLVEPGHMVASSRGRLCSDPRADAGEIGCLSPTNPKPAIRSARAVATASIRMCTLKPSAAVSRTTA